MALRKLINLIGLLRLKFVELWMGRYRVETQTGLAIVVLFVSSLLAVAINQKLNPSHQVEVNTQTLFDPYDLREPVNSSRALDKLILGY